MLKLSLLSFGAWTAGWAVYLSAVTIFGHAVIRIERIGGAILGSLCPYGICLAALYFPALFSLKDRLGGPRPIWLFAFVSGVLGVVPIGVMILFLGGDLRSFYSPEALFLYAGMTAVGLVLGTGFSCIFAGIQPNR